ncbi:MafI family immunity protein, partial [Streptomyces daliensis]|nr:MafI family immunity protein [Streptomyces daliensis]
MPGSLLGRVIDAIQSAPVTEQGKRELLSYVVAGEYALAVELLCDRLGEGDHALSENQFQRLAGLCGELEVPRGHLDPVAELLAERGVSGEDGDSGGGGTGGE